MEYENMNEKYCKFVKQRLKLYLFKISLASLLSFILIFSISCKSNEAPKQINLSYYTGDWYIIHSDRSLGKYLFTITSNGEFIYNNDTFSLDKINKRKSNIYHINIEVDCYIVLYFYSDTEGIMEINSSGAHENEIIKK